MLKLSVTPVEGGDRLETVVESSGPLSDVVSELGLAILRMHEGLAQAQPLAAQQFKRAVVRMFSDPEFWDYEVEGECLQREAKIITTPKFQ